MRAVAIGGGERRIIQGVDLAEHQVRRQLVLARICRSAGVRNRSICGVRRVVLDDAIIFEVCNIEVAVGINRDAGRKAKIGGRGGVEIVGGLVASVVKHVDLADHQVGSLPVGK